MSNGLGADHIFLQELCHDEADEVKNLLQSRGYAVLIYEPSYRSTHRGWNLGWGEDGAQQIVASRDSFVVSGSVQMGTFPWIRSGQGNGYACGRFVRGGYSTRACTTHLESRDVGINEWRGNHLLDLLTPHEWCPTVVGGDFNRTPDQLPVTTWRWWFGEVDPAQNRPTFYNDHSPTKKVDYVFIQSGKISAQPGASSVSCYDTESDHCFLGHHPIPLTPSAPIDRRASPGAHLGAGAHTAGPWLGHPLRMSVLDIRSTSRDAPPAVATSMGGTNVGTSSARRSATAAFATSMERPRIRGRFGLWATLLVLLGVSTSCGNQPGEGTVASSGGAFDWAAAVDGVDVSGPYTSFVVADDSWAVVVDGGLDSARSGQGSLRVFSSETGPEGREFALPGDDRRALPFTWQSGSDEISVLSAACPRWEAGSPAPIFNRDGDEPEWLQNGCGNSTFDLWTWNRSDQTWREVARGIFTSPDGVNLSSSSDERLIVALPPSTTDPERWTLNEFHLIDAAKGTMSPLPAPPDDPHIVDVEQCFTADGTILMGATTQPYEVGGGAFTPGSDELPGVVLFSLQGDEWHPVEIDYPAASAKGCDDEAGLVLGRHDSIALVTRTDGRFETEVVAIPDGNATVTHRMGGPVLSRLDPDDGVFTISTLVDGAWKDLGPTRDDGALSYVIDGGLIEIPLTDESAPSSPIAARA